MDSKKIANKFMEKVDFRLVTLLSSTKFLSGLYYCFFSRKFGREHQSVLKGRLAYYQSLKESNATSAMLRRNVHRLEKGLIMRPRREVFGEEYVLETVEGYVRMSMFDQASSREMKWAFDVIKEFFNCVSETEEIAKARRIFGSAGKPITPIDDNSGFHSESFRPYLYASIGRSEITYDQLKALFRQRRSVRWYQDKPVDLNLIHKAIDIATLAPSACNRQPYSFMLSSGKDQANAIAACAGGTAGFSDNLQSVAILVGDLGCYFHERDRHLIYIDSSLAAMQFMLALESLGLSSCPINWPDVERAERRIREVIDLPEHKKIVMLIAIGYADARGGIAYSQKKLSEDIASIINS